MLLFYLSNKLTNDNSPFIKYLFIPFIYFNKTMGDRYNIHSQLEHLQSKYVG